MNTSPAKNSNYNYTDNSKLGCYNKNFYSHHLEAYSFLYKCMVVFSLQESISWNAFEFENPALGD